MGKFLNLEGLERVMRNINRRLDEKQGVLVGQLGQVVGFDAAGASALTLRAGEKIVLEQAGGGLTISSTASNPNLLDNWHLLDPVNQRKQNQYGAVDALKIIYTIDRWLIGFRGIVEVTEGGMQITAGAATTQFHQRFDPALYNYLLDKTVTASALVNNELLTVTGKFGERFTKNFGICAFGLLNVSSAYSFAIMPYAKSTACVQAAKLELGTVQTLAHQDASGNWVLNDPPPDPPLQILKCQRYLYNPFYGYAEGYAALGIGQGYNSTIADIFLHNRTPMRIMPTPIYKGAFSLTPSNVSGADIPVTKIEVIAPTCSVSITTLRCTVAGGITVGGTYILRKHNDMAAEFLLSADL